MKRRSNKEKVLVSACLLGINCRFDGKIKKYGLLKGVLDKLMCLPVCPEVMAGGNVPRLRTEINGAGGVEVLSGRAKVFRVDGVDVTDKILEAAHLILSICRMAGIKKAILKEKSPCCGKNFVYDGSFTNKLVKGKGVVTALLQREGIKVFNEKEYKIKQAASCK